MSKEEVKIAIHDLLEQSSEKALKEVLEYLEAVKNKKSTSDNSLKKNLNRILKEDKNLLNRLAK
ncbi:hypothetical protein [Marivirga sp.]|uniref:hypothetical protein n=1 Tax=Marivirga sp. TaxID=2018662 RepID=UPI0025D7E292|nr:hypothetical protein [Marivirga sp.]